MRTRSDRLPGPSVLELGLLGALMTLDPYTGVRMLHERYGAVCAFGAGPFRFTYLFGPEANEAIVAHPERFRWREAFDPLVPLAGETALIVSDGEEHRRRRRLVAPAFHRRQVDGYHGLMLRQVDATIDGWRAGARVDAFADFRACIRRVIVRSLFGESMAAVADELGQHLEPGFRFMNRPLLAQLRLPVPKTGWPEVVAARDRADRIIYDEIRRRRRAGPAGADPDAPTDVLDWLLVAASEGDAPLGDVEIRDQVASLIAAGYDTTSSAVGWMVLAMARDPEVWAGVRAEVDAVVGADEPTVEQIGRLRSVDAVVSETLRLWPPVFIGARQVVEDFEVDGREIRAGTRVTWSPFVTHRDPQLWPEPETFRPARWDPDAPGYEKPAPFTYLPFGWGSRGCLGFAFAQLQMKLIAVRLVQRTTLELAVDGHAVAPAGMASLRPRGGVPVVVSDRT